MLASFFSLKQTKLSQKLPPSILSIDVVRSCQKVQKCDFENQFSMSKYGLNPFKQKKTITSIIFGAHFLLLTYFDNKIFKTLFSKMMPNF